jgi:hypothetical protein
MRGCVYEKIGYTKYPVAMGNTRTYISSLVAEQKISSFKVFNKMLTKSCVQEI